MLSMKNVSKIYRTEHIETHALSEFNLEVALGSFVSVMGPSGSGKTTFLNLAGLLDTFERGSYELDGIDVSRLTDAEMSRIRNSKIGFIFQTFNLIPDLNVFDNVDVPLRYRGVPAAARRKAIEEALELVGLSSRAKHHPSQLSGGQQQRVAIARTLAVEPDVLLLDEPLSNLDAGLRAEVRAELVELQRRLGLTTILVTHDQEEALTMSDRIAVMNDGKVAQVGRPEDLYDRPTSRFVAGFIGESNFLPAIVRGIEDDIVVAECEGAIIRALSPSKPAAGEKVVLTTRPERLRFADTASNPAMAQNRLSVTVTEAVFAGERCRYMLQAGDGTAMVLKEPSSAAIRRRSVGERAEIAWSVADTILV